MGWIRDPGSGKNLLRIPILDPGVKKHRIPDQNHWSVRGEAWLRSGKGGGAKRPGFCGVGRFAVLRIRASFNADPDPAF
jgi:hypothetical protein